MTLKTRKPTGAVPWPLILIEGGEKAGKSWACAELSASPKVGQTYWIDFTEDGADEYGAVPGARYLVIDHDGSWGDILHQVEEVKAEAARAAKAGEPPVVLVIDSMSIEWEMLKDWATQRAKGSKSNKERLRRDPAAEIKVPMNLWNDATARHRRLMTHLMTFPGIVVATARGKEVASLDDSGRPVEGSKEYKVEGHKTLAFDASVWVRLSRDAAPVIVGARSVHAGIRPGRDEPKSVPDFTLEWLIFDVLKCDPRKAHTRRIVEPKPERLPEHLRDEAVRLTTGPDRLRELWEEAKQLDYGSVIVSNEKGADELLPDLLARLGRARAGMRTADRQRQSRLESLWAQTEFANDADGRTQWMTEILGRPIDANERLSGDDEEKVVARLDAYIKQNTPPAEDGKQAAA